MGGFFIWLKLHNIFWSVEDSDLLSEMEIN